MSTEWSLTVDIRINEGAKGLTEVLRFTNSSESIFRHGFRIPLITLFPDGKTIDITSSINDDPNSEYRYNQTDNQYTNHVEIHQRYISNGEYRYFVIIDGQEKHSTINKKARQFHNVHVWACSSFFFGVADVYIGSVQFTNFL